MKLKKIELKNCPFCKGSAIITRDKLAYRDSKSEDWSKLQTTYKIYCSDCLSETPECYDIQQVIDLWNHMDDSAQFEPDWISCKERLPKDRQRVLIIIRSSEDIDIAIFDANTNYFKTAYTMYKLSEVKHWMELPKKPEVVKDEH